MKAYWKEQWTTFLWSQATLLFALIVVTIFTFVTSLVGYIEFKFYNLGVGLLVLEAFTIGCLLLKLFIDFIKLIIKNMK